MQVDFPNVASVEEQGPEDYLLDLYDQLGWDRASQLDPRRITINEAQWGDISAKFIQTAGTEAGLFWMNYGPSASIDVPYGLVEIQDGAFEYAQPAQDSQAITQAEKTAIDTSTTSVNDRRSNASVNDIKQEASQRANEKNTSLDTASKEHKPPEMDR